MINTKTKVALAIASVLTAGAAQAATTHTMTNGSFTFYDALGAEVVSAGHNDVQGTFDMVNGGGQFTTSTPFNGLTWVADVNAMTFHSSMFGGTSTAPEAHSYDWITNTYWTGTAAVTCRIAGSITTGCDANIAAGYLQMGSTNTATAGGGYSYTLSLGQFAAHTFFDWSTNLDIPVLAVLQVTSGNPMTGPATVVSVDSDGDGTPGTAMVTNPFPGQTPSFAGTIVPAAVPVPAAVWLFGSGLLGLVGVARRKKAQV